MRSEREAQAGLDARDPIRGETELSLMRAYFELDDDANGILPETREFLVDETLTPIAEKWKSASAAQIAVPPMPADIDLATSIAKGRELFYGDKANCVKCHGVTGLGDGQANDYDDWNKSIVEINKEIKRENKKEKKEEKIKNIILKEDKDKMNLMITLKKRKKRN